MQNRKKRLNKRRIIAKFAANYDASATYMPKGKANVELRRQSRTGGIINNNL